MKKSALIVLFLTSTILAGIARTKEPAHFYTIQLGAFDAHRQSDFEAIRSYAYVYDQDGVVFIGGFSTLDAAQAVLDKVKAKGYSDAFIVDQISADSKKVSVIQLAALGAGEPIDWSAYEPAGALYTLPADAQVRIVHGVYDDVNDARVKLKELQAAGFPDAFVRSTRESMVHAVTGFDKGTSTGALASRSVSNRKLPSTYSAVTTRPATTTFATGQRKTGAKLQTTLKYIGAYTGTVDGVVGKGTEQAYASALKNNRRLRRYAEEARKVTGFGGWEDARLLLTIVRDLDVKDDAPAVSDELLASLPAAPIGSADLKAVTDWNVLLLAGIENWSTKSQYNDQVASAFKTAYFKTQLQLEDYYLAKGVSQAQAAGLALLEMKILIGDELEGYY